MSKIINLTPHEIKLNDGTVFPPSGYVARVSTKTEEVFTEEGIRFFKESKGGIEGMPPEIEPTALYIVSRAVFDASNSRYAVQFIAPATASPEVVRDEKGQIVSVPGFIQKIVM